MSKWWFSLFSRILFSEPLKLSRNHPEVLILKWKIEVARTVILKKKKTCKISRNVTNTYFWSYSILVPEPPVKVYCHHFFVFWAMIHQVLRFLGWKLHFEKEILKIISKFKWTQVITLQNWKNHRTKQNYTFTFAQNYLKKLLKVSFSSFPSNNIVKMSYKWISSLIFQFGGRNGTSNLKAHILKTYFRTWGRFLLWRSHMAQK